VVPLRTLLFVPGNRADMIEKARSLPADCLVLDLEDSVPLAEKTAARGVVQSHLPGLALGGQQVYVRVNSLASGLVEEELEAVIQPGVDGISVPKIDSPQQIEEIDRLLSALERARGLAPGTIGVIPWIESARAILFAFDIAVSSPRLVGLAFGADDYTLDMGIQRSKEGSELLHPRAQMAIAAHAAAVLALDTPYVDFRDEAGLVADTNLGRQLGYQGRFVIHPSQIEPVNRVFRPSEEEVATARRLVAAFDAAQKRGSAVISFEGKMVDTPVAEKARRLIEVAESIAQREGQRANERTEV